MRNVVRGQRVEAEKKQLALELRSELTPAEQIVWARVRRNGIGFHFRRQQVIRGYVVDFYCHAAALAVELDGAVHNAQIEYDAARTAALEAVGITVIRFANSAVETDLTGVLERIASACRARTAEEPNPPAPFPGREGGALAPNIPRAGLVSGSSIANPPPSLPGKGAGGLGSSEARP